MQKVFWSALRELVSKRFFYTDYKPPSKALLIYTKTPYKDVSEGLISDSLWYSSVWSDELVIIQRRKFRTDVKKGVKEQYKLKWRDQRIKNLR